MPKGRPGIPRRLLAFLEALPLDVAFEVVVRRAVRKRTDAQNAALFGYAYKELAAFTGYTVPEIHDVCLRGFFGEREVEVMGRVITKPRRTTTTDEHGKRDVLGKVQFSEYLAYVLNEAGKLGLYLADPSLDHYLEEPTQKAVA